MYDQHCAEMTYIFNEHKTHSINITMNVNILLSIVGYMTRTVTRNKNHRDGSSIKYDISMC